MLIIEFLGMPASGKTTISNTLLQHTSLEACYFSSDVIPSSPDDNPYSYNYRFLTYLSKLLKAHHTSKADFLILDRGVYDTDVWLNIHHSIGNITSSEFEVLSKMIPLIPPTYQYEPFLFMQTPETTLSRRSQAIRRQDEWAFMPTFINTLHEHYRKYRETIKEKLNIIHSDQDLAQVKAQVFRVLYRKCPVLREESFIASL